MGFVETFGPKLVSDKGAKTVDTAVLANVPVVVYYFSAAWCGPCKMLTPKLAELYKVANAESKQLEVVFISADQSEPDFKEYFEHQPWLAAPFDEDKLGEIAEEFDCSSIPMVLVMKKDGTVKKKDGRKDLEGANGNYQSVINLWKA